MIPPNFQVFRRKGARNDAPLWFGPIRDLERELKADLLEHDDLK